METRDFERLLKAPVPFEMDLPWGDYRFSQRFYSIVNDWGTPTESEVNFINSYIKRKESHILDLTCGGGRHALGLAELGYRIIAIDIGGYPLNYARHAAKKKGYDILFSRGDVRKMKYEAEFELAFLICGQLGHFSPEDALRIFSRTALALKDEGIFILHLPVFEAEDKTSVTHWYREKEPFYFPHPSLVHREQFYFSEQRIKLIRDFAIDTVTRKNRLFGISEKNYNEGEIRQLADKTGFKIIEQYGCYQKSPMKPDSKHNIYVLSKK